MNKKEAAEIKKPAAILQTKNGKQSHINFITNQPRVFWRIFALRRNVRAFCDYASFAKFEKHKDRKFFEFSKIKKLRTCAVSTRAHHHLFYHRILLCVFFAKYWWDFSFPNFFRCSFIPRFLVFFDLTFREEFIAI